MYKYFLIVLMIAGSACTKNQQTACGTQACTDLFASIGLHFTDKNNNPVVIANFTVIDLRTNKAITHAIPEGFNYDVGYMEVLDDNDIKDLSTEGDNIQVSATDPATGQTKTVTLKIAGGCNCHVTKLSGPDTVQFD